MINFLKKFFQPKEEAVQFSELNKWLDNNNTELQKIKEDLKELGNLKSEIAENLKILGGVDISQAKVEDRVKGIVKGNLPAYINAINLFLKKVAPPEEVNHITLEIFCDSFENEFKDLNKRTFRNFQIIREIVGKELENVAKSVKKLEILVKDIKKYSAKIKKIAKVKEKIGFIKDSLENKEKNKLRGGELEKEKGSLVASCEKIKKDIEKLKNSSKAKSLENLESEEKKISGSIKELETKIITLFSPLQKALKKYNNMCFIKKVNSYIENPVETLLDDSGLEILKFLKDVKKMIEEGKIDLKDDKKKKSLQSLDTLNEPFIKKFIEDYCSLKKKASSIKDQISANTVLNEIGDLEKEFNINSFKIENIKRDIDKLKDVDVTSEISKLEKRLDEVFGYKIKIENVVG